MEIFSVFDAHLFHMSLDNVHTKLAGSGPCFADYVVKGDFDFTKKIIRVALLHAIDVAAEEHLRIIREQGDATLALRHFAKDGKTVMVRTFHDVAVQSHRIKVAAAAPGKLRHRLALGYSDYTTDLIRDLH